MQKTKTIELLEPHRKQYEFLKSPAKFRAFIGGLGSGKTMIGCAEMIRFALSNPKTLNMIVAPTYPMLRDSTQRTFFELCPQEEIIKFNKTTNELELSNGSEILFRSADNPEMLRGVNLASFYLDEGPLCARATWLILIGRLRQMGFNCKGWMTGTPKGFNWVYEEFVKFERKDHEIFFTSSLENPFLSKEYIESLQDSYSGVFARQEILGQFVAPEGVVYSLFNREMHVKNCKGKQFNRIIYGVDWGFTNPMVCLAIGIDSDNRIYVLDEIYQKKLLVEDFISLIKNFQTIYGTGAFYADPSEPQLIQQLNNAGLNCHQANNAVLPGIQEVSNKLEIKADNLPALFIDPKCVNTIMEFENYRYADVKEGRFEKELPLKVFDHALDALRYAVMSLNVGRYFSIDTSEFL